MYFSQGSPPHSGGEAVVAGVEHGAHVTPSPGVVLDRPRPVVICRPPPQHPPSLSRLRTARPIGGVHQRPLRLPIRRTFSFPHAGEQLESPVPRLDEGPAGAAPESGPSGHPPLAVRRGRERDPERPVAKAISNGSGRTPRHISLRLRSDMPLAFTPGRDPPEQLLRRADSARRAVLLRESEHCLGDTPGRRIGDSSSGVIEDEPPRPRISRAIASPLPTGKNGSRRPWTTSVGISMSGRPRASGVCSRAWRTPCPIWLAIWTGCAGLGGRSQMRAATRATRATGSLPRIFAARLRRTPPPPAHSRSVQSGIRLRE